MQYSDEEKQAALRHLAANDGNVTRTSRETGIPRSTLRDWKAQQARRSDEMIQTLQTAMHKLEARANGGHTEGDEADNPLLRLHAQLVEDALALAKSLQDGLGKSPLSHRATALNQVLDKIIRLTEMLDMLPAGGAQVIRVEYENPDDDPAEKAAPGAAADCG
jgi:transposase-like protein